MRPGVRPIGAEAIDTASPQIATPRSRHFNNFVTKRPKSNVLSRSSMTALTGCATAAERGSPRSDLIFIPGLPCVYRALQAPNEPVERQGTSMPVRNSASQAWDYRAVFPSSMTPDANTQRPIEPAWHFSPFVHVAPLKSASSKSTDASICAFVNVAPRRLSSGSVSALTPQCHWRPTCWKAFLPPTRRTQERRRLCVLRRVGSCGTPKQFVVSPTVTGSQHCQDESPAQTAGGHHRRNGYRAPRTARAVIW